MRYQRLFKWGLIQKIWRPHTLRRPQASHIPPFRRTRIKMGMSLETVCFSLMLPKGLIEKIENGDYQNITQHPDFLAQAIKDYGKLLEISKEDIDHQLGQIALPQTKINQPIYLKQSLQKNTKPWFEKGKTLGLSLCLSYIVWALGWWVFYDSGTTCTNAACLSPMVNSLYYTSSNNTNEKREKCKIGQSCHIKQKNSHSHKKT